MPAVMEQEAPETVKQVVQATRIDSMITYPVAKQEIAELRQKFGGLACDTPKGYESTRLAIAQCRELRGKVEKRRKELKADSLEFGRKVDAVAKHLTSELLSIEEPLALLKSEVDDRKQKEREAKEAAERAKVEAELKAKHEAEQARLKAEREAEEAKLAQERAKLEAERAEMAAKQKAIDEANRIERQKMEADRAKAEQESKERQAKIDAENTERQRAIDEANRKIETERKAIEAAKQKAEREEFERQAKIKAEFDAREKAEAARHYAELEHARKVAAEATERARLEAMKPDIEKVHAFAKAIRSMNCPGLRSDDARTAVNVAMEQMAEIASVLECFQGDMIPY